MFRKTIFLLFAVFLLSSNILSSQNFAKVPKQYSLEFGYRNLFAHSNITLNHTHGYGGLFDYSWQLSGFDGTKNKSFISVPMGYTIILPDDPAGERIAMLNYGWTVRHELTRNSAWIPFVGYGLFLNDLTQPSVEGSVFGHQTEFDLGVNYQPAGKLIYFAKLQYSYTSYPQRHEPERIRLHYADVRLGVRF